MNVRILDTLSDAPRAVGEVVVIDVFRASTTVVELLTARMQRVVAVEDLADARRLGRAHPDWLLLGERNGLDVEGFEGGNSPVEASAKAVGRTTAVLTTSGGTRIMHACGDASFWVGAFTNARALSERLRGAADVSLWAVGRAGRESAPEDRACADFLAARLQGQDPPFEPLRRRLAESPGGRRLKALGRKEDLDLCLSIDTREILPRRTSTIKGWPCLTC